MNPLLEKLHDIEGLDHISFWPLALGWLLLLVFGIFTLCIATLFLLYRISFKRSWKYETLKKLGELENNLSPATAKETVIAISSILRRIALLKFSRKSCASLMGQEWLQWLTFHDQHQFNWVEKGTLLVEVPYAPLEGSSLPLLSIKDLIQATKNWVH